MTWSSFKEIYEYIGRFCVDFEGFCSSMEACVRTILHKNGLTDESLQVIVLSGYTAEPLRTLLQRLIGETIGDENNKKILSKVFGHLQELIEDRNDLIHSKWLVYGNLDEVTNQAEFLATGEKLHANKDGAAIKNFNLKKEEVEKLDNKCREACIMVSLLMRCVLELRKIDECFSIEEKVLKLNYEALKPIERTV